MLTFVIPWMYILLLYPSHLTRQSPCTAPATLPLPPNHSSSPLDYPPTNHLLQPSQPAYTTYGPLVHCCQFSMFVLPRVNCTSMLTMI
ncbi:hypothetical protein F4604DRAFT_960202 [Suillus subluteus]|nr:hypothetical protein F4604DRAFT_960202 [Suillus subluteus]